MIPFKLVMIKFFINIFDCNICIHYLFNYFVVDSFLVSRVLLGAIVVMIATFSGKLIIFFLLIIQSILVCVYY